MKILVAVLLVMGLFGLNVLLYKKNRETPVPEGCENLVPDCKACGITDCALRNEFLRQKEE